MLTFAIVCPHRPTECPTPRALLGATRGDEDEDHGIAAMSSLGRLVLTACLALFLSDEGGRVCRTSRAPWLVQAQGAPRSRRSGGGRQRPSLHNQNHESTVRNIVLPRFKSNPLVPGNHTSNVAIVVSSSRYWFNYRHVTNALSIYQLLKRGGMTDDSIVLMLADDIPCNMRNPYRGKIFPRGTNGGDLMEGAEVDYSGTDVTVDAFLRVLLGRHLPGEESGQRSWPSGFGRFHGLPPH